MKNRILNIIGSLKSSLVVFFIFISIINKFWSKKDIEIFFLEMRIRISGGGGLDWSSRWSILGLGVGLEG